MPAPADVFSLINKLLAKLKLLHFRRQDRIQQQVNGESRSRVGCSIFVAKHKACLR